MFCHSYKPYKCYQGSLPPSPCPYPSQFFLHKQPSTNFGFTFTHEWHIGTDSKVMLGKLLRETHTHSSWILMTHRLHRVNPSTAQGHLRTKQTGQTKRQMVRKLLDHSKGERGRAVHDVKHIAQSRVTTLMTLSPLQV